MEPSAAVKDYSAPQVLLPFLAEFVQKKSPYDFVAVAMLRDGCLRFRLKDGRGPLALLWSEFPRGSPVEVPFSGGVVSLQKPEPRDAYQRTRCRKAARHVAGRLSRLLSGDPPDILLWRNRNPQRIQHLYFFQHMFNLLPGIPGLSENKRLSVSVKF